MTTHTRPSSIWVKGWSCTTRISIRSARLRRGIPSCFVALAEVNTTCVLTRLGTGCAEAWSVLSKYGSHCADNNHMSRSRVSTLRKPQRESTQEIGLLCPSVPTSRCRSRPRTFRRDSDTRRNRFPSSLPGTTERSRQRRARLPSTSIETPPIGIRFGWLFSTRLEGRGGDGEARAGLYEARGCAAQEISDSAACSGERLTMIVHGGWADDVHLFP